MSVYYIIITSLFAMPEQLQKRTELGLQVQRYSSSWVGNNGKKEFEEIGHIASVVRTY